MLSRLLQPMLRLAPRRSYYLPKKNLQEVLEYKRNRTQPEDTYTQKLYAADRSAHYKDLDEGTKNKEYLRIMNDWKNNLVQKKKKAERRIEEQQNLQPREHEYPKLIAHR